MFARRWWLEDTTPALRRQERETLAAIRKRQRPDGSFGGLARTICDLYALHLLQRDRTPEADKALDWLWETGLPAPEPRGQGNGVVYGALLVRVGRGEAVRLRRLRGTPFAPGCTVFVKTSAAILLASLFNRGREARVQRALRTLDDILEARGPLWCSTVCSSNLLCAYASHPEGSRGRGMGKAVRALAKMQAKDGTWPGMPFAATFHSLATIDAREARAQVKRAIRAVERSQNTDGSWGWGPNKEFTTFQVVQALRAIQA